MADAPAQIASTSRAQATAGRFPPLLVAADRVAATVAQGVHGRRRVGRGDSFWQFRPYTQGDPINRIDWRQSAKSSRPAPDGWFLRETEWEAAQTVCLWRDASASMRWRRAGQTSKADRADLLYLATAALLLRGGERVLPMRHGARSVSGRHGLERLAADMSQGIGDGVPPDILVPRHGTAILIGDFFAPLEDIGAMLRRLTERPSNGYLLQVVDPAEATLPYTGRIRFEGVEDDGEALVPRAEALRADYKAAFAAHCEGLAALCRSAGFGYGLHTTDHAPEVALLALHTALGRA